MDLSLYLKYQKMLAKRQLLSKLIINEGDQKSSQAEEQGQDSGSDTHPKPTATVSGGRSHSVTETCQCAQEFQKQKHCSFTLTPSLRSATSIYRLQNQSFLELARLALQSRKPFNYLRFIQSIPTVFATCQHTRHSPKPRVDLSRVTCSSFMKPPNSAQALNVFILLIQPSLLHSFILLFSNIIKTKLCTWQCGENSQLSSYPVAYQLSGKTGNDARIYNVKGFNKDKYGELANHMPGIVCLHRHKS